MEEASKRRWRQRRKVSAPAFRSDAAPSEPFDPPAVVGLRLDTLTQLCSGQHWPNFEHSLSIILTNTKIGNSPNISSV